MNADSVRNAGPDSSATSVCAIVVTYNPDQQQLLELLGHLNRETDFLVIDNGSSQARQLEGPIRDFDRCVDYRMLADNQGLAKALNMGLLRTRELDYQFALLFDQDSKPGEDFAAHMLSAFDRARQVCPGKIAAVGPRLVDPRTHRPTPFKVFNRLLGRSDRSFYGEPSLYQADFLITSGTLLWLSCLQDVGLMKDDYFIDNIDLEWCFRARSAGYELTGTAAATLYHVVGESSNDPLVRRGLIALHQPERTYYSSRNRVHLYGLDYSPWGWKLRDCPRFALKVGWLLLTSSQRKQYWNNISAGIRDARSLR